METKNTNTEIVLTENDLIVAKELESFILTLVGKGLTMKNISRSLVKITADIKGDDFDKLYWAANPDSYKEYRQKLAAEKAQEEYNELKKDEDILLKTMKKIRDNNNEREARRASYKAMIAAYEAMSIKERCSYIKKYLKNNGTDAKSIDAALLIKAKAAAEKSKNVGKTPKEPKAPKAPKVIIPTSKRLSFFLDEE